MNRDKLIEDMGHVVSDSAILDLVLAEVERLVGEIHKASFAGKNKTGQAACEECFRPWPCPTSRVLSTLKPGEKKPEVPVNPWLAYANMMGVALPPGIG